MVNLQPIRDDSYKRLVRKSVRQHVCFGQTEVAVSLACAIPQPKPATRVRLRRNEVHESLDDGPCLGSAHITTIQDCRNPVKAIDDNCADSVESQLMKPWVARVVLPGELKPVFKAAAAEDSMNVQDALAAAIKLWLEHRKNGKRKGK